VFPKDLSGSPHPGEDSPPVPPTTPVFDVFGWLCWLAGQTERIRLGTHVYLLGLRHPFVAALGLCKRLWCDPEIEHQGEFFSFDPVIFEPKPVQRPWPTIHAGGESEAALRRAATHCDGWIGLAHTFETARPLIERLRELREEIELGHEKFEISLGARVNSRDDVRRWSELGVDRLMVAPWSRSREALDGLRRFAEFLDS